MIKHEKIAARVRRQSADGDGSAIYRLSKPLQYVPYDNEYAADEYTWFVEVHRDYTHSFIVRPWDTEKNEGLGYSRVVGREVKTDAQALDALGYELIEEEK